MIWWQSEQDTPSSARRSPSLPRSNGRCAKTSPSPPAQLGFVARHRHVADGALVLDVRGRGRMVDGFAAHAGLPVGIARIRHHAGAPVEADRDVLAGRRGEAVVAGDATVRV